MRLALTGGVACGKSTAAEFLKEAGCAVLSTDALAHRVLVEPAFAEQVAARFGAGVLNAAGNPDRAAIGKIVFADPAARAWLEGLLHPEVNRRWRLWLEKHENAGAGGGGGGGDGGGGGGGCGSGGGGAARANVVEIPLLYEKHLDDAFDAVVCVHCSPATQLRRLIARNQLSEADARARIAAQMPLDEKVRRAAFALFNDGSRAFLGAQIRLLLATLAG
jgi:dephospho-CoA kinase